jgi:hypothetical protein
MKVIVKHLAGYYFVEIKGQPKIKGEAVHIMDAIGNLIWTNEEFFKDVLTAIECPVPFTFANENPNYWVGVRVVKMQKKLGIKIYLE